ncbi:type II secretion system F family protein [Micromonospora sp. NBC_01813]|uniref:type II secretion system F family protein n=1 Tax=Micromonospora sp. NBC_01813 TaxID=2975988 RepID=UPI002DDB6086|nr:type II secretion protein F [Micromonospora sp. NBC_01813]WSA06962.1 type II secretion protein F [Micromonospora sp. NBC_01813]
MRALFALLGAGVALAVLLLISGLRTRSKPPRRLRARRESVGISAVRLAGVLAVAAVAGVATRWPVAAVLAGIAAYTLPAVLGPDRAHRRDLARVEAIAAWAENLSGTLRSAAGLEQTIAETAAVAPAEIRAELVALGAAPRAGIRLPAALRGFARDMADPTADLVANVLLQAAEYEARDISGSLDGVGRAARRQASARLRIATGRARTRTSVRIIITVIVGSAVGLVMFARDFLSPYDTALGQLILAVLGAGFAGCLLWMVRIGRIPDMPRILTGGDDPALVGQGTPR